MPILNNTNIWANLAQSTYKCFSKKLLLYWQQQPYWCIELNWSFYLNTINDTILTLTCCLLHLPRSLLTLHCQLCQSAIVLYGNCLELKIPWTSRGWIEPLAKFCPFLNRLQGRSEFKCLLIASTLQCNNAAKCQQFQFPTNLKSLQKLFNWTSFYLPAHF